MNIRIETRRWKRLLKLFAEEHEKGIEYLTNVLQCSQAAPSDLDPIIRAWNDMKAVVQTVIDAETGKEEAGLIDADSMR